MKPPVWLIFALLGTAPLQAQDELPKHASGETMDFEPKLMLDGPRASLTEPTPAASLEIHVSQLEAALPQAEKRAVEAEQFCKEGIMARVEVEARSLRVVELRKDLADARLSVATAHADAVNKSFDAHETTQSDLDAATVALKSAQQLAAAATADWDKARLDAARLDVQRKLKLHKEGVCSQREVEQAEDRLALLSGTSSQ